MLRSIFTLIFPATSSSAEPPATHIAIATDHVIESFRNDLYPGYKTGSGIPEELYSQFSLMEEALELAGFVVWPMTEYEADDALATAAHKLAKNPKVKQILICTPDKDLAQCLTPDKKVLQLDRRKEKLYTYEDTLQRFGVLPESIPDYLGLVGDTADGFPGLAGFGAKTSSTLLQRYKNIEAIPKDAGQWDVQVRGAEKLSKTLNENYETALLFKELATLKRDVLGVLSDKTPSAILSELEWQGPKPGFEAMCEYLGATEILEKIQRL